MSLFCDDLIRVVSDNKTHFPLLEIENIGSLTLWPITKIQYEMFISQANRYGDTWYDEILTFNPRISYQDFNKKNYERLFITGLHVEEAQSFSIWFGEYFRIPTVEEWRNIYQIICDQDFFTCPSDISIQANIIWEKIMKFSKSPIQFTLMKDGVVEWVKNGEEYVGLGAPRPHFHPNVLNPETDLVSKIKRNERLHYFGFRLIKGIDYD